MKTDVVVIGGGPSGMSAALKAKEQGASVLLIDVEPRLGGILNQCIHNGFGLKHFKEELTGPEYADRLAREVEKAGIDVMLNSYVNFIQKNKVYVITPNSQEVIDCGAIVLAAGARERTAGEIYLKGKRLAGVYTAGTVQKMINFYGKLPGKKAVILGSGDIGLIMARRLTLEGVEVKLVCEIMSHSSGLRRNIRQCIEDFNIPLLYNHTVTRVVGKERVEGIYYAEVDENRNIKKETEKFLECDCLLLSVGLIPENTLLPESVQRGKYVIVDDERQTSEDGIFVSGNVLHIHDLADNATEEGEIAGKFAGLHALGKLQKYPKNKIYFSNKISYTMPELVNRKTEGKFTIYMRANANFLKTNIVVSSGGKVIAKKFCVGITTGEMQEIEVDYEQIFGDIFVDIGE